MAMDRKINRSSLVEVCRICLQHKNDEDGSHRMTEIMETTVDSLNISLYDLFFAFTSLSTDQTDEFPTQICTNCLKTLVLSYEFQLKCIQSDQDIRTALLEFAGEPKTELIDEYNFEISNYDTMDTNNTILLDESCFVDRFGQNVKEEPELIEESTMHEVIEENDFSSIFNENSSEEPLQFKCEFCKKIFNKFYNLERHLKLHDSEGKPFECKICKRRYATEKSLNDHEVRHAKNREFLKNKEASQLFKCPECPREYLEEKSLALHTVRGHPELNVYSCEHCQKSFYKLDGLRRHMRIHIDPTDKFRCRRCDATFAEHEQLVEHRKKHTDSKKPYVCPICSGGYYKLSKLEAHMLKHDSNIAFLCSICGKSCSTKQNLKNHLKIHDKPFECSICSLRVSTKSDLNMHMITHTCIKPFKCETCGKGFTRRYTHKQHVKQYHTVGEKAKQNSLCTVCNKRFRDFEAIKRHMRTHTGEKPYKCEFCDRGFAQSGDLKKHRRLHVGYDIYKCKECPSSFKKYPEFKLHMEQHYLPHIKNNPEHTALLKSSGIQ